jgi:hypothetical protein
MHGEAVKHRLRRRALGHQHGGGPRGQRKGQRIAESVGEEELGRGEADVVLAELQHVLRVQRVGPVRIRMRMHGALRRAGGARRIEPERDVVGVRRRRLRLVCARHVGTEIAPAGNRLRPADDPHGPDVAARALHRPLEHRQQRVRHDRRAGAAVRQHVRVVSRGQQRVHGDRDDAGVERAEERHGPLDAVVREQQHALLAAQPVLLQDRREPAQRTLELAIRKACTVVDIGDAIRARGIAGDQVLRQVELRRGRDCVPHGRPKLMLACRFCQAL